MRFRAKLVNYVSIQQITRVVQTVARISKSCTLILSPSHVVLVFNDSATKGNVCMWCEMNQISRLKASWFCRVASFEEYRIEGKDDRNEIYLDLAPDNVARVLKTSTAAEAIKIKLTKKLSPCLTFEVILVSICLPEIKLLRNILEKMKNLSSHIVIAGSREGKMSFCVDSSLVSVTTYFQDLEVLTSAGLEPAARLPSRSVDLSSAATTSSPGIVADLDSDCELFDVKVDLRRLSQFVFGQQILPKKVVAHITHQVSLHLFVVHDDASMQYILPALNV